MRIAHLELDLDVFAGPFDLLLSLILREELDLLEVDLAEVVIAYLDHLESLDELDLESATEFLVLIAALLELKSRLMLPGEEVEELDELAPAEAAEELVERMVDCLAGELRDAARPDWTDAIKRFEAERTVRTARVQDTARTWGDIWHVDGVGRLLRNELFRRRDPRDYRYTDWLYG